MYLCVGRISLLYSIDYIRSIVAFTAVVVVATAVVLEGAFARV